MTSTLEEVAPFVRGVAHRATPVQTAVFDRDDAEQEAMIGAWQALPRWDPELCPLQGFLFHRVRGAVIDARRRDPKFSRYLGVVGSDHPLMPTNGNGDEYDVYPDPGPGPEEIAVRQVGSEQMRPVLNRALGCLSEGERYAVMEVDIRGLTLKAAGLNHDPPRSESGISLLRTSAHRRLREMPEVRALV